MACQRRTICSAKFLTGLLCGVVMGFVMGSFHLAIVNSGMAYKPGTGNPCDGLKITRDNKGKGLYRRFSLNDRLQSRLNNRRRLGSNMGQSDNINNAFNFFGEYGMRKEFDIQGMFEEPDGDSIYEIDSSKLEQLRKPGGSDSQYDIFPIKIKLQRARQSIDAAKLNANAKLLYVGVMTAGKYVATRGKAIQDTWAKEVPGKVELFVGEGAVNDEEAIITNVVQLKKVDDGAYPPQKKSFMMLKYMHDQYINGFEWFMRADDDAYVKIDKLETLLRKLNSSKPIFIGQMGYGNTEERGKLTLDHGENYCMGGPGMIFSREVIRRIAPNIGKCLGNMYTTHEDVEVSRCVSKYANVKCTWSYEMKELFYEHYTKRVGYIDHEDVTLGSELRSAITLHPNKNPAYHRRLHIHFLSEKIKQVQARLSRLHRDFVIEDNALRRSPDAEEFMLGIPLSLNRYRPANRDYVMSWDFFADRTYSVSSEMPRRGTSTHLKLAAKDIILQLIEMMNRHADVKGRVISYKRINYAYSRVNPIFGSEYVLDLLLYYNRYRGKKVTLPVRRHAYLQQTFGRTVLHEHPNSTLTNVFSSLSSRKKTNGVLSFLQKIFINPFSFLFFERNPKVHSQKVTADDGLQRFTELKSVDTLFTNRHGKLVLPTVNIIIPLSGRFSTFQRFMTNLESVAFSKGEPVSVLIMVFVPSQSDQKGDMRLTQQLVDDYSVRYPAYSIRTLPVGGEFSRGVALEVGASQFSNESLLFFCDVDVVFNSNFLRKCRSNTVRGETVYYPVLFSEFDPSHGSARGEYSERKNHYTVNENAGYWRGFGYGLLCVYQSDFTSTGGFDTSIKGWGLEDVDLFGKFVQKDAENRNKAPVVTAKPFRVKDPDLIHVYHHSHCDTRLESRQFTMCLASRSSSIMSVSNLYKKWNDTYVLDEDRQLKSETENLENDPLYAMPGDT